MTIRLIALNDGPDIAVGESPLIVGRHSGCDIELASRRVSRRHCCLIDGRGEVLVRDLGSLNGTWVNGRRVVTGRLRPGDELSIAWYLYRIEPGPSGEKPEGRAARDDAAIVTLVSATTSPSVSPENTAGLARIGPFF